MTEQEILNALDNSNDGYYCSFVELGHVYSYLIDTRLNVFTSSKNEWVIAIERLGYNPRADAIILDINYFGNCLINLEIYNERPTSYYSIYPIDRDNFEETVEFENLKSGSEFWIIRGEKIPLCHDKEIYKKAGLILIENEANEISVKEVARFIIQTQAEIFRATDKELYKSIPSNLNKKLSLDEWYHKDFNIDFTPSLNDNELKNAFEFNKSLGDHLGNIDLENFKNMFKQQEILLDKSLRKTWNSNRPSSYETWQQIAKVIVTNDPNNYRPTKKPNTHWKNWKNSGSM